jgi:hypothetical protein
MAATTIFFGHGITQGPDFTPGALDLTAPGSRSFTVPFFPGELVVEVWGAGAGGRANGGAPFNAGGTSSFGSVVATGGAAGTSLDQSGSAGGVASGGDINTPGQAGADGYTTGGSNGNHGGKGGDAPNGGAGGPASQNVVGISGDSPGGGGAGGCSTLASGLYGGGGGSGAYSKKTYAPGSIPVGSTVAVQVGAGGPGQVGTFNTGGRGADGRVKISWS